MSNYWWLSERTWSLVTVTHRKFGPTHHNSPNSLIMTAGLRAQNQIPVAAITSRQDQTLIISKKPSNFIPWIRINKYLPPFADCGPGQELAKGWTVWRSNPGRDEIFRTRPDWSWGPHRLLYNGYRVIPGGKAARAWRWPPTPSNAEVKRTVELYLHAPTGPSWRVIMLILLYVLLAKRFPSYDVTWCKSAAHRGLLTLTKSSSMIKTHEADLWNCNHGNANPLYNAMQTERCCATPTADGKEAMFDNKSNYFTPLTVPDYYRVSLPAANPRA